MQVGNDSMRDIAYMTIDVHHAMTATMAERHMRCWIQRKTWAAAACWQLLIAPQLPRNDWCLVGHRTFVDLKNMSEAQLNEEIIPTIADLEVTRVVGSRLKKLIKLRRESAEVSWDPKRKEAVENEDVPSPSLGPRERGRGTEGRENHPSHRRLGRSTVMNNRQDLIKALRKTVKVSWDLKQKGAVEELPLSSEELKCSGALCLQQVQTAPFRSQDAVETVGSRLERQLNKHYISLVGIPKIKTREEDTAGTRVKRTMLGDETKLAERKELERKQSRAITSEDHPNVFRSYILDLTEAGAQGLQDNPDQPKPMPRSCMTMYVFLLALQ